jgi:hypothetical protein
MSAHFAAAVLRFAIVLGWHTVSDVRRAGQLTDAQALRRMAGAVQQEFGRFAASVADAPPGVAPSAAALEGLRRSVEPLQRLAQQSSDAEAIELERRPAQLSAAIAANTTAPAGPSQREAIDRIDAGLKTLAVRDEAVTRSVIADAQASSHRLLIAAGLAAVLTIVLSAGLFRRLRACLADPIRRSTRISQARPGDLSAGQPVDGSDETAQLLTSLSGMAQALHAVVSQVRSSIDGIQSASGEITAGSWELSHARKSQPKTSHGRRPAGEISRRRSGKTPTTPARPTKWRLPHRTLPARAARRLHRWCASWASL